MIIALSRLVHFSRLSVWATFALDIYFTLNLNQVVKFCKVHHFADDTNLVKFIKLVIKLNKYISIDMKNKKLYGPFFMDGVQLPQG